jgi:hypothetical protein
MKPLSTKLSILALGTVLATGLLSLPSSAHTDPVKHHKGKAEQAAQAADPAEGKTATRTIRQLLRDALNEAGGHDAVDSHVHDVPTETLLEALEAQTDIDLDDPVSKKRVEIRIVRKGDGCRS